MSLELYQIIVVALSAIMIYQGFYRYISREAGQNLYKLIIRILVWGGVAIVAIFPKTTMAIAKFIGIEGNINAVILIGFLLTFFMIFKLLSAIERLENKISTLTRDKALEDINNNSEEKQ
ncbi:MAG: DUF2304 domain-containing protein [Candidatus Moranbacteria bacterium]|nr:DUF2304 domain-containing protein [Candidatus Moranbacteria bacterium]